MRLRLSPHAGGLVFGRRVEVVRRSPAAPPLRLRSGQALRGFRRMGALSQELISQTDTPPPALHIHDGPKSLHCTHHPVDTPSGTTLRDKLQIATCSPGGDKTTTRPVRSCSLRGSHTRSPRQQCRPRGNRYRLLYKRYADCRWISPRSAFCGIASTP